MFGLGFPELLVIFFIVLIVFGAGKLPEIGMGLGKALRGFKKGISEPDPSDPPPRSLPAQSENKQDKDLPTKHLLVIGVLSFLVAAQPLLAGEPSNKETSSAAESAEGYYHTLLGLQYEEDEEETQALEEYQKALSYDTTSPFLLGRIGTLLAQLGKFQEAIPYLEKVGPASDEETMNLLANLYASAGDKEKAVSIFETLIARTPREIEGYINLTRFMVGENDFEGAIRVLSRGIEADPASYHGPYYLAKLFVHEKAYDKGIEQYQKAIHLYPAFEPAYLELAALYEQLGRKDETLDVYRQVLAQPNMEHKEAGIRLVHILIQKEAFDEATLILNRLVQEKPDDPDIWLKISLMRAERKEYTEAREALEKVLAQWPHATDLQVYSASLYEMQGAYEQAAATYQEALNNGGDPYDIHTRLGFLYLYRLKKPLVALSHGEEAKTSNSGEPESYLLMGQALYELKRFEEAVSVFEQGAAIAPNRPDFHFHLGTTYDKLNRPEALIQAMEQAIALDPQYAVALNYLGYTYADKGIHLDYAVDLIHRALRVQPDDGYYVDSLGWAYYKQGKTKEALELLKKAATLVQDDPVILEHLGEVYLKENQRDAAYAAWALSLKLDAQNEKLKIRFQNAGFTPPSTGSQSDNSAH